MNSQAAQPSRPAILASTEADRRINLLADLQSALAERGIRCVLARNHKLVLRWHSSGPWGPSGPTDPQLHVFTQDGTWIATTDGITYSLTNGARYPADTPDAAAAVIAEHLDIASRI